MYIYIYITYIDYTFSPRRVVFSLDRAPSGRPWRCPPTTRGPTPEQYFNNSNNDNNDNDNNNNNNS